MQGLAVAGFLGSGKVSKNMWVVRGLCVWVCVSVSLCLCVCVSLCVCVGSQGSRSQKVGFFGLGPNLLGIVCFRCLFWHGCMQQYPYASASSVTEPCSTDKQIRRSKVPSQEALSKSNWPIARD